MMSTNTSEIKPERPNPDPGQHSNRVLPLSFCLFAGSYWFDPNKEITPASEQ